jgi:kumamolisin
MTFRIPNLNVGDFDPGLHIYDVTSYGYITPQSIASVYNIPASTGAGTRVGIISLGGGFLQNDVALSLTDMGLPVPTINFVSVDGMPNNFDTGAYSVENTLDIYCVAAMVPAANISIYIAPNNNSGLYDAIARAVADNCDVITISWGIDEVSLSGGDFLNPVLSLAASRGITVLCCSGDFGSSSAVKMGPGSAPSVEYPASSPYVIGVGGTSLSITPGQTRNYEYAAQSSGGGISTLFSLPSWQTGLRYSTVNPLGQNGPYNLTHRGVPDIAAPFYNYVLYFNGSLTSLNGTSAGTPVMAGMIARFIALKNGQRPANGAVTINTLSYANPGLFFNSTFDRAFSATTGGLVTNDWSNTNVSYAYATTAGSWNPVTGLGAVDGTKLYNLLPAYVAPTVTNSNISIKTGSTTWANVGNVYVKTSSSTWATVQHAYVKTVNGWRQTF